MSDQATAKSTHPIESLVLDIKHNALDDGPGIRSVVFLKGCPLDCQWCHNPESKSRSAELSFDSQLCIECEQGHCVCPQDAISHASDKAGDYQIDFERCTLCFECVDNCPTGAFDQVGVAKEVEQVWQDLARDRVFYETSGGGVTLSGGEPLLHMEFASGLLQKCKQEGLHTLVQTCGLFHTQKFDDTILPWLDVLYFDLKLIDVDLHTHYCGADNKQIQRNFSHVVHLAQQSQIELLPRIPLVPSITAEADTLEKIRDLLIEHEIAKVKLVPYNPIWPDKSKKLGKVVKVPEQLTSWMSAAETARCEAVFLDAGIQT